jgi:Family of unknown function (DUF6464)
VVQILLIFAVLLCLVLFITQLLHKEELRHRQRLLGAIEVTRHSHGYRRVPRDPEEHYIEGVGYIIGDLSCFYNACSPYIRCAINPGGLCDGCRDYRSKNSSF